MERILKKSLAFRAALLIAGTSIGGGMLAIPLVTAKCGFLGALFITLFVWAFMTATGLLLLEATLNLPEGANFLSIAEHYLGKWGQRITGALFLFLYYFLMVAYVAAGGMLLHGFWETVTRSTISEVTSFGLFGILFGFVVYKGPKSIDRVNVILTLGMGLLFLSLFFGGIPHISSMNLKGGYFPSILLAAPILFSAFGYHNIIPSLVTYLKRDREELRKAIIMGTTIPLVVYLLWQFLIIGALPLSQLERVLSEGLPVTLALANLKGGSPIPLIGNLFAFIAIATSVLGVSFSLVDFLADGFKVKSLGSHRLILTLLTFFPPFFCASIDPTIFDKALGIAGGIGESLINGVIPVALVWSLRYVQRKDFNPFVRGGKQGLIALLAVALLVMGIEIMHLVWS